MGRTSNSSRTCSNSSDSAFTFLQQCRAAVIQQQACSKENFATYRVSSWQQQHRLDARVTPDHQLSGSGLYIQQLISPLLADIPEAGLDLQRAGIYQLLCQHRLISRIIDALECTSESSGITASAAVPASNCLPRRFVQALIADLASATAAAVRACQHHVQNLRRRKQMSAPQASHSCATPHGQCAGKQLES